MISDGLIDCLIDGLIDGLTDCLIDCRWSYRWSKDPNTILLRFSAPAKIQHRTSFRDSSKILLPLQSNCNYFEKAIRNCKLYLKKLFEIIVKIIKIFYVF